MNDERKKKKNGEQVQGRRDFFRKGAKVGAFVALGMCFPRPSNPHIIQTPHTDGSAPSKSGWFWNNYTPCYCICPSQSNIPCRCSCPCSCTYTTGQNTYDGAVTSDAQDLADTSAERVRDNVFNDLGYDNWADPYF